MSIGQTEMSIRPLDKQKCPLDIQMCIRHFGQTEMSIGRTEMSIGHPNVHSSIGRMDSVLATTLVSYPHGVRLSQITSLQLPWHCKRYMSIEHK